MNPTQAKIQNIIEGYKARFSEEYALFCNSMEDKRETQKNEFASTGQDGAIGQLLKEIPLTLHNLFEAELDPEEKRYYSSKIGSEWFARTFKEFSPAERV